MPVVLTSDLNEFKSNAVKDELGDPFASTTPTVAPDPGLTDHLGGGMTPTPPGITPDTSLPPTPTAPLTAPQGMPQPPGPVTPPAPTPATPTPPDNDAFNNALSWGKAQMGKGYIWGSAGGRSDLSGNAPGYDCSGFVSQFYHQMGMSIPAQTSAAYAATSKVSESDARPGDVVEFNMDSNDPHEQHIAIYLGGGKVLQSGGTQASVNIGNVDQFGPGTFQFRRAGDGPNPAKAEAAVGQQSNIAKMITTAAARNGIDPSTALRVSAAEGGSVDPAKAGDGGSSFGPFQLHYGGVASGGNAVAGLGDDFTKQTGLDARDPKNVQAAIDFAMQNVAKNGWGAFHGAARAGIGTWDGVGNTTPGTSQPNETNDPQNQADAFKSQMGDPFAGVKSAVGDAASQVGSTVQDALTKAQAFKDSLGTPFQNAIGWDKPIPATGTAGVTLPNGEQLVPDIISPLESAPSRFGDAANQGDALGAAGVAVGALADASSMMPGEGGAAKAAKGVGEVAANLADHPSLAGFDLSKYPADVQSALTSLVNTIKDPDLARNTVADFVKANPPNATVFTNTANAARDINATAPLADVIKGADSTAPAAADATSALTNDAPHATMDAAGDAPPAETFGQSGNQVTGGPTEPPDWQAASARGVELGRPNGTPASAAPPSFEQLPGESTADWIKRVDGPTASTTPPAGPTQVAPTTIEGQNPLTFAINQVFQKMENIPDGPVKDALTKYAAMVGSQSQGARVMADTAGHQIAESGPILSATGMPLDSAASAESHYAAQARAELNGVLQKAGLDEKTPEIAAVLKNITGTSDITATKAGQALMAVNNTVKGSLFGLSNMHNYTEALTTALAAGPQATADYARAFLSKNFYEGVRYGDMAPSFDRWGSAGVTGLHVGEGGSDVYKFAQLATRSVIGAVGGAATSYEESLRSGDSQNAIRNAGIGALGGAAAGAVSPALFGGLFQRAVPLAKVTLADRLAAGGMAEKDVADAVNRTFGGLNYAQMGRSQTLQDGMRLLMTAPDWNEATVRSLGTAITGKGGGANFQRSLLVKAVVGPMIGSELLSYALNGHGMQDNEPGHQLEVQVGTDQKGQGVYMGFMPGNYQAYGNLIDKIAGDPSNASDDIGKFGAGRVGLPLQALNDAALGTEYIGGPKAKNEAASLLSRAAPIGTSSVAQGLEAGTSPQDTIASMLLGPNLRYGTKPSASSTKTSVRPTRPGSTGTSVRPPRP